MMLKNDTSRKSRNVNTTVNTTGETTLSTSDSLLKEKVRDLFDAKAKQTALNAEVRKLEAEVKKGVLETKRKEVLTYQVVKGSRINIRAGFNTKASNKVDKDLLLAEIGLDGYAKTATVTQASVTKAFGSNVLDRCLIKGETAQFSVKRVAD